MPDLSTDTPFNEVIPILTRAFKPRDEREQAILSPARSRRPLDDESEEEDVDEDFSDGARAFLDEVSELGFELIRSIESEVLEEAAEGDSALICALGIRLGRASARATTEEAVKQLIEDSILLLGEAANGGDPRAQWILGERFSRMKSGLEEGIQRLGQAASGGLEQAAERLRVLYERRYVFTHDPSEQKWLKRFAQAGVVEAQFDFSRELHLNGELKSAFFWMSKAAGAGHSTAQERLAFFYEVGEGCSRDHEKAAHWRRVRAGVEDLNPPRPEARDAAERALVEEIVIVEPEALVEIPEVIESTPQSFALYNEDTRTEENTELVETSPACEKESPAISESKDMSSDRVQVGAEAPSAADPAQGIVAGSPTGILGIFRWFADKLFGGRKMGDNEK